MLGFVGHPSIGVGLVMLLVVPHPAESAQGQWCETSMQTPEYAEGSCGDFMAMMMEGYNIDRERSGLIDLSNEDLQNELSQWLMDPANSPPCVFVRMVFESSWLCCPGWTGAACDEIAEDTYRYCYMDAECSGPKPDIAQDVTTRIQCCSVGGYYWGGLSFPCEHLDCATILPEFDPGFGDVDPEINVIENTGDMPFRTCMSYGPNYYRTFDGLEYRFAGRCSYIVFRDQSERTVHVTNIDCTMYSTCKKQLEIILNARLKVVAMGSDIVVYDNEVAQQVFVNETTGYSTPGSVPIEKMGVYYYLEYGSFRVRWDEESTWFITLEEATRDADSYEIGGLCGNFDENPLNDMRTMTGQVLDNPAVFGNAWVNTGMDFTPCPDASLSGYECRTPEAETLAKTACKRLLIHPFVDCHSTVNVKFYYHRCLNDYCSGLEYTESWTDQAAIDAELEQVLCVMADSYSYECSQEGQVMSWRSSDFCPRTCPSGMEYSDCSPKCTRTCQSLYNIMPADCYSECYPGCRCPIGTFLHADQCVVAEDCPCVYKKQEHQSGSRIRQGCNDCICEMGRWHCGEEKCSRACSIIGYQHFYTFDGRRYEFQGAPGEYTVVELTDLSKQSRDADEKGNLHVYYEVWDCTSHGIMCISSVTIHFTKEGYDMTVVIGDDMSVTINGESMSDPTFHPHIDSNMYVVQVSSIFIMVKGFGYTVLYDSNGRLYVTLEPYYTKKIQGLCGNMDGDITNDWTSKSGIEEQLFEFAVSYSLFQGADEQTGRNQNLKPCSYFAQARGSICT